MIWNFKNSFREQLIKMQIAQEKRLSQKNAQSASFLPLLHQSRVKTRSSSLRNKLFSKHRGKSRTINSSGWPSLEWPPSLSSTFTDECESPRLSFLGFSTLPYLLHPSCQPPPPSNHLGTSIMNETYRVWRGRFRIRGWEIDTRGFLRETRGWEKLLEMWKRREAWPCLLIPCYLFIFFLMRISVADLGDDCNCCEDNIEIMIFLSDQF